MKKLFSFATAFVAISVIVALTSCSAQTSKAQLKTDVDSLSYAFGVSRAMQGLDMHLAQMGIDSTTMADFIRGVEEGSRINPEDKKEAARMVGVQIGQMIAQSWIPGLNQELFGSDSTKTVSKEDLIAGFIAGALNKNLKISAEDATTLYTLKSQELQEKVLEAQHADKKEAGLKFLEDNKANEGVKVTESGLQYKVITEGTGPKPTESDNVKVHYVLSLIDGTELENSVQSGQPFPFSLAGGVIAGWIEGVQLMNVGSKYVFYIPYKLAYGAAGRGTIEPFSTLIFEIELLEIVE